MKKSALFFSRLGCWICLFVMGLVPANAQWLPDSSFQQNGALIPYYSSGNEFLQDALIGDSQKIYTLSVTGYYPQIGFRISVFQPNGSFDERFNDLGYRLYRPGSYVDMARAFTIDNKKRWVVTGRLDSLAYPQSGSMVSSIFVGRILPNSQVDSSFGVNGWVNFVPGGFPYYCDAYDIETEPDGSVIIAGTMMEGGFQKMILVKWKENGTLDSTFGLNGISKLFSDQSGNAVSMVRTLDSGFAIAAFNSRYGTPSVKSATANRQGKDLVGNSSMFYVTQASGNENAAILLHPNKRFYLGFGGWNSLDNSQMVLHIAKNNEGNGRDFKFATKGARLHKPKTIFDVAVNHMALMKDGSILACGQTTLDFKEINGSVTYIGQSYVAKFDEEGRIDTRFGDSGYIRQFSYGAKTDDQARRILVTDSNHFILLGSVSDGSKYYTYLYAYKYQEPKEGINQKKLNYSNSWLDVFPNPIKPGTNIYIEQGLIPFEKVKLIDAVGREIHLSKDAEGNWVVPELMANGIYLLQAENAQQMGYTKLVIQDN